MLKSHKKLQDQFLKQVRKAAKYSADKELKAKTRKEFWLDIERMCQQNN